MSTDEREIAFEALMLIDVDERKSHLVIRDVLDKYDYLDNSSKNFIKRVVEGTVQKRITLDYAIDLFSDKKIAKCKPAIREILRMAAYQIIYMERVPYRAACDEAVKLCMKKSRSELSGFVNAVLRKLSENVENIFVYPEKMDEIKKLSVKYSMPENIVMMLKKEQDDYESLIEALSSERPTVVRVTDVTREKEIVKAWEDKEISFEKSPLIEHVYRVRGFHGAMELPGFNEGLIYIQDESSMICVKEALKNVVSNPVIMDLCAAPGGKTMYASELLNGKGNIYCFDISDEKVELLRENVERLGISNVKCDVSDASSFNEEFKEAADVVIADVPCSGIGVLSRKSDLKYHITNEGMASLTALQKEIILNAARYVKPGGLLAYSTCTIHKAENEKCVKYLLKNREDFELEYERQLRPDKDNTDGFYIAGLRKKK